MAILKASLQHDAGYIGSAHANKSHPTALTSDDSIRRSNSRNDVLDDTLRKRPRNTLDVELLGTGKSALVQPFDVIWIVVVEFLVYQRDVS